jgi:hypothetical protein
LMAFPTKLIKSESNIFSDIYSIIYKAIVYQLIVKLKLLGKK